MDIYELKKKLERKATVLNTGGFRPTNKLGESWIGSVRWKENGEEIPLDNNEKEMLPIATFFIKNKEYAPKVINDIELITIFMSSSFYRGDLDFNNLEKYFIVRSYKTTKDLIHCEWNNEYIKCFPLTDEYVNDDYPILDDGGIPEELLDIICEMEDLEEIDYFYDIVENLYTKHKIGGYPCFCQSGYWFNDGYEYVLQISSDAKAKFNIVDSGNFYFFYNKNKNSWKVHCDFY